jgi:hypothetical protein
MTVRRLMVRVGVGLLLVVAGYAAVRAATIARDPYGHVLRARVEPWVDGNPAGSPYTDAHSRATGRLVNEIARRSSWTGDDEEWLASLLAVPPPAPPAEPFSEARGSPTNLAWESWFTYGLAMSTVSERLGLGAPTPERIVRGFEEAVLFGFEHPHADVRAKSVSAAQRAGWLERPEVRAAVERLAAEDESDRVRRMAGRFLLHHEGMPVSDRDCPTCPGRGAR